MYSATQECFYGYHTHTCVVVRLFRVAYNLPWSWKLKIFPTVPAVWAFTQIAFGKLACSTCLSVTTVFRFYGQHLQLTPLLIMGSRWLRNVVVLFFYWTFINMRTPKFKAQQTNASFTTSNQIFGGSYQLPTTAEHCFVVWTVLGYLITVRLPVVRQAGRSRRTFD